jgi:hypothetical protein
MGISQLGGTNYTRLITKSGSSAVTVLPNNTGASANTANTDQGYGAWTQLVASTSVEYLLTGVTARTVSGVALSRSDPITVDLGIGGSGSEATVATVQLFGSDYASTAPLVIYGGSRDMAVPVRVPAGTRLAFRVALYVANSTATSIVVMAHAVPYANVEGN